MSDPLGSIAEVKRALWLGDISDSTLRADCGSLTFERGSIYARTDRVLTLHESADGRRVVAVVRGSTRRQYQTVLELHDRDPSAAMLWSGTCSCPVAMDCKHVVAAVLIGRDQVQIPGGGWEGLLSPLLAAPEPEDPGGATPIALEIAVVPPSHHDTVRLRLRPVRPTRSGRKQKWTAQGASWSDVMGTGGAWARPNPYRSDHRALLAELHGVWQATSGVPSYTYGAQATIHLDQFGPGLWSLLQRCLAAGIEIVPGPELLEVVVRAEPVEVGLDLTRPEGPAGPIDLAPTLTTGGDELAETDSQRKLMPVGAPMHGIAVLTQTRLTLAPLRSTPPAITTRLLEHPTLRIPAEDADRFLRFYGPALRRRAPTVSSDHSVVIEEPAEPIVLLDITARADHTIGLELAIGYPRSSDGEITRMALDPGPDDPPRDHAAEADLLAGMHALHQVPGLINRTLRAVRLRPTVDLRSTGAIDFVTRVLPDLRDLDRLLITVIGTLPTYAEADGPPVVHLEAHDGQDGDWFDLHVQVTVDGQEVPFEDLFSALARGEQTLMLASGTWFGLDRPELEALRRLIDEARDLADPDSRSLRLTVYQAGLWQDLVDLGVVDQQSARWQQTVGGLLALGDGSNPDGEAPLAPPTGLRATLRPYQLQGYRWLSHLWDAGLGGVLADDMGLGKTVQTLAMIQRAHETAQAGGGPGSRTPVLVVAPASVVSTWAEEAARFCPELAVTTITSTAARRRSELRDAVADADLVVTSYTLLRLEAEQYQQLPWSALILDEAQFVKNHQSKTYHAARGLGAQRTFAITGTPLENSLMDLWAMLSLAAPGLYPDPEMFGERFRKPIERGYGADQLAVLRRRIRPFLLRRTKDLVAPELPERQEQVLRVPLAPAHQRIYSRHLQRERQRVLGMLEDMQRNRIAIFRALTALRQMSLDPGLVDDEYLDIATSAKTETLLTHVRELVAEGHRALVFSTFTGYLSLVRAALEREGIGYSYLDGATRNRSEVISGFRTGTDPLFLISLKAGGFGLTLTEADYVFLLDPWWNPAAEAQAIDRTHRIGQTRPVMVYRLVSRDTIEEKVLVLQERKRRLFSQVVDDGEFRSGAITADDIRDLLG